MSFSEHNTFLISCLSVVELGAGCALPSLLSATLTRSPSVVLVTDYPDQGILQNLTGNVERNRPHYSEACSVYTSGYEWGQDISPLL